MTYIILPNLQIELFFIFFIIKNFKRVFIYRFAIDYIIIYFTTIIPNILGNIANCIGLGAVRVWLT